MEERSARTTCVLAYVLFLGYTAALLWCAYRRAFAPREVARVFQLVPMTADPDSHEPPPPAVPAPAHSKKRKD